MLASLAALVGEALPQGAAVDSFDMLVPLMGRSERGRDHVVEDTKLMVTTGTTVASSGARILALRAGDWKRSEEHTSELQSLMRISYAVFCLKKKKNTKNIYHK